MKYIAAIYRGFFISQRIAYIKYDSPNNGFSSHATDRAAIEAASVASTIASAIITAPVEVHL